MTDTYNDKTYTVTIPGGARMVYETNSLPAAYRKANEWSDYYACTVEIRRFGYPFDSIGRD